jgi:hypothetical protein
MRALVLFSKYPQTVAIVNLLDWNSKNAATKLKKEFDMDRANSFVSY